MKKISEIFDIPDRPRSQKMKNQRPNGGQNGHIAKQPNSQTAKWVEGSLAHNHRCHNFRVLKF